MNKLIINSADSNFYNHITTLLEDCKSFYFSVAFINFSGVQLLFDNLKKCEEKGIKGKDVLDLGCGTAEISIRFKKKGYSVLGVDISDEMLAIAGEKIDSAGLEIPHDGSEE